MGRSVFALVLINPEQSLLTVSHASFVPRLAAHVLFRVLQFEAIQLFFAFDTAPFSYFLALCILCVVLRVNSSNRFDMASFRFLISGSCVC